MRLYVTGVLARIPQGMTSLCILLLVRSATHSYAVAGVAVGGEALAAAAIGPTQGRLVDRYGRTRVLSPLAIVDAVLFLLLVLAARAHLPGGALVALACGAGAAQPAVAPSVRALLRTLFDDHVTRERAYSLDSITQELIWITGPLLAGAVATVSPADAVLLAAALCLAGTALLVASPASRGHRRTGAPRRGSVLREIPELRVLLMPVALMGVAIGATEVGLPSLALHAGSRASTGLLLAAWSVGSMIGGLLYGARTWGWPLDARYRTLLALAVVCALPLVFARSIPAGLLAALATGLTIAPVFACQYALMSRAVSDGTETEAFTWASSALVAGSAGGAALGGSAHRWARRARAVSAVVRGARLRRSVLGAGARRPRRRSAHHVSGSPDPLPTPRAPALPAALVRLTAVELTPESTWEDVEIGAENLDGPSLPGLTLRGVRLTGTRLADAQLAGLELTDVELSGCDLANARIGPGAGWRRVLARDCRLTGVSLADARLRDVTLRGCRVDLASFAGCRLQRVTFENCLLAQTDFLQAQLDGVRFLGSELIETDLREATLHRCELRDCRLDGLRGVASLQGAALPWPDIVAGAGLWAQTLGIEVLQDP